MRAKAWRLSYSSILVLSLSLLRPGVSAAGPIYTLTGDLFNSCSGTFLAAGGGCGPYSLSGSFEVTDGTNVDDLSPAAGEGQLLSPGFNFGNLDGHIEAYSFSDGNGLTISSTEAGAYSTFNIATDASGNITWWYVDLCLTTCNTSEGSYWFPSYPQTYEHASDSGGVGTCFAFGVASPVGNCGGGWSGPTASDASGAAVPEPSSIVLLGIGLVALGIGVKRIGG